MSMQEILAEMRERGACRESEGLAEWADRIEAEMAKVAAAPAQEWMPIESAPKDELILVGPTKHMGICAAINHSRDGWVTETCSDWHNIYTPTHWQPLPAPPSEAKP